MNAIADQVIQTTTTLPSPQIQRRARSNILEQSGDNILGQKI